MIVILKVIPAICFLHDYLEKMPAYNLTTMLPDTVEPFDPYSAETESDQPLPPL